MHMRAHAAGLITKLYKLQLQMIRPEDPFFVHTSESFEGFLAIYQAYFGH
jgi:hypothetical protein